MTDEQKLIRECLEWLIYFEVTAILNDDALERLGDLIEKCHDVVGPDREPPDPKVV